MSAFDDVVKYLDRTPARVATESEALNALVPFDKYYGRVPARAIDKLKYILTLKAYKYAISSATNTTKNLILFEYQFIAVGPFYIVGNDINRIKPSLGFGFLTVRWRVGSDAFRYVIASSGIEPNVHTDVKKLQLPTYDGQLIPANAVFEFWAYIFSTPPLRTYGLLTDVVLTLNYLTDPVTPDDLNVAITKTALGKCALGVPTIPITLSFNLPMANPQDNSAEAYLDNP